MKPKFNKKEGERLMAYQKLLDTMKNSLLVQSMSLRERNNIKANHMKAGVEDIMYTIDQIEESEKEYRDKQKANEKEIKRTTDNMQALIYEAEKLLSEGDVTETASKEETEKEEHIQKLENQLKNINKT